MTFSLSVWLQWVQLSLLPLESLLSSLFSLLTEKQHNSDPSIILLCVWVNIDFVKKNTAVCELQESGEKKDKLRGKLGVKETGVKPCDFLDCRSASFRCLCWHCSCSVLPLCVRTTSTGGKPGKTQSEPLALSECTIQHITLPPLVLFFEHWGTSYQPSLTHISQDPYKQKAQRTWSHCTNLVNWKYWTYIYIWQFLKECTFKSGKFWIPPIISETHHSETHTACPVFVHLRFFSIDFF